MAISLAVMLLRTVHRPGGDRKIATRGESGSRALWADKKLIKRFRGTLNLPRNENDPHVEKIYSTGIYKTFNYELILLETNGYQSLVSRDTRRIGYAQ